jgi:hypothetical protein
MKMTDEFLTKESLAETLATDRAAEKAAAEQASKERAREEARAAYTQANGHEPTEAQVSAMVAEQALRDSRQQQEANRHTASSTFRRNF